MAKAKGTINMYSPKGTKKKGKAKKKNNKHKSVKKTYRGQGRT